MTRPRLAAAVSATLDGVLLVMIAAVLLPARFPPWLEWLIAGTGVLVLVLHIVLGIGDPSLGSRRSK